MNSLTPEPVVPANEGNVTFTIHQIRAAVQHWGADDEDRRQAKSGATFGPNASLAIEVLATMDFQRQTEGECPSDSQLAWVLGALEVRPCADAEEAALMSPRP
ncbi:hypothetical protein [Variovorax gossypii]|uniref:hypothetical protein n=1 Tax=uncultured Variovorax sp. TaxID=114708 RepID=UPI002605CE44|nr:hypothetical protein [uncultured Variovorax sp.]